MKIMSTKEYFVLRFIGILFLVYIPGRGEKATNNLDQCFCMLKGQVDDCSCTIESIDSLNNFKIYPILDLLLSKDYFRYFKVNLNKPCPFWEADGTCSFKDCSIKPCKHDDIPVSIQPSKETTNGNNGDNGCKQERELSALDTTLSENSKKAFKDWGVHDDSQMTFCQLDDEDSSETEYVDLSLNPEKFTGYKGYSAHRIWSSIYNENCFKPEQTHTYVKSYSNEHWKMGLSVEDMCIEKRAFYRMVSGLHTSINMHVSAKYLLRGSSNFQPAKWGRNVSEFIRRFDPAHTGGEGPQRLRNLYFTYLLQMRAILKAAPYLLQEQFYTGNMKDEINLKELIQELVKVIRDFPDHFDESQLFKDDKKEASKLKEAFKTHFHNISRIMDCVGCDKCKLWGKLQITGMGTALKILFSGDQVGPKSIVDANNKATFHLERTEIVSLLNAFGRLSSSIKELDAFRRTILKP